MKKSILLPLVTAGVMLFTSCNDADSSKEATKDSTATTSTKTDLTQLKTEIQGVENQWADAINKKDMNALIGMYSDDAISMPDGEPMLTGKAAIQKKQEADFAKPSKFHHIAFETMDVYSEGDAVTEVGKTMYKDSTNKTIGGGKYFAVFQKKDGKYLCIREIYNSDTKDQK